MSDVAVLITSQDSFSDCQPVALKLFEKYWADCPWPLLTTSGTVPWGPRCLLTGHLPWVPALRNALAQIESEFQFVCHWLEDMTLCRQVHTNDCRGAEIFMDCSPQIGAIRLGQGPEYRQPNTARNAMVGLFVPMADDSPYRISTSPTLWRVSYLQKILENCGETAWEFEGKGTEFSRGLPEEVWMTSHETDVDRPFRQYYTAITRGKWNRGCLNWLERTEGITIPDLRRGIIENEREP